MFVPNDIVVYPAQGVGKIERIETQEISGTECKLYIVCIKSNNVTLMVPVANAAHVGLRALTSPAKAKNILQTLRTGTEKSVYIGQNWNRRFREYSERLKHQDLAMVADVLRELLLIGKQKELSFGERRLQEQAMELVTGELAVVLQCDADEIRDELLDLYAPLPAAAAV